MYVTSQYTDEALRRLLIELRQLAIEATLFIKLKREEQFPGTKDNH